jgi:arylsulfatase
MTKFVRIALLIGALSFLTTSQADTRPNIVLIMVDDMGWSNIGPYGGMVETPTLDRLARDGVRFNQFYNAARCCPTRATLMTGLHPHQVGVGHMILPIRPLPDGDPENPRSAFGLTSKDRAKIPASYQGWLDEAIPTLPEMLKAAGYGTYMTGKWHLANEKPGTWPRQRGFDRFYGHLAGTSDFFRPANLHRGNEPITATGERYYITDAISEQAIEFLGEHERKQDKEPFFLYLAYNAPHFPVQCMPEEYEKYQGRFMEGWDVLREQRLAKQKRMGIVPQNTRLAPRPDIVPAWDTLSREKQIEMDAIMATYAGMIDRVDQNIGKLVRHLEQTGELDNTILFFLSDNGGEAETGPLGQFDFKTLGIYGKGGNKYGKGWATLSNTPFREYKHFTHQGGVQSPLIVHWPAGIAKGNRNRIMPQSSYLPDLVETCLDVANASRPKMKNGKAIPDGDGISLAKTLQGAKAPLHNEPIFIEHEGNRIARDGKWKLVAYHDKPWELFDLDSDRSESDDLAKMNPQIVSRLKVAYAEWAEHVGAVDWTVARGYSVYGSGKARFNRRQKKFRLQSGADLGREQAPYIAGRGFSVSAQIAEPGNGVIVAQGGIALGWALFVQEGKLIFAATDKSKRTVISTDTVPKANSKITLRITKSGEVTLRVNGKPAGSGKLPGPISEQPLDGLQIGKDSNGNVGDYPSPFPFTGQVKAVEITFATRANR